MKKFQILATVIISLVLFSVKSHAEEGVETLSPGLRALLTKEMVALQDGMKSIIPAYVSGDMEKVSEIAKKMKNSYILKQTITADQKNELMTKLPKSFVKTDKKFHEFAGMLEHVAEEKHLELVGFYYSKLIETCVSCHSDYASHKFPHFTPESSNDAHHH